ncbi:hypothetical protein HTZ77_29845 [Nonomuraea sp. SMC257]|uniref:Uncharacterized protein n=1 Tax=Nonomuraea montanisoli TaxID=2741721 RepID=A0A7Y6IDG1_9ACTN|nr:hypothetical protein [Nonomuraea montanisoli]NUW35603.1 hypothetical protein [Nonomuraea montanisoli]
MTATHPSRLSRRDLIKDLGTVLPDQGIKLIVYVTGDAIQNDDYARTQLCGPAQAMGERNATYQANWLKVVKTWAQQWGTDVDARRSSDPRLAPLQTVPTPGLPVPTT